MRANYFVELSKKCTTDVQAVILCAELIVAFLATPEFVGFSTYNEESYMEGATTHLRFQMNKMLSNYYILAIEPVIRDSQLTIDVMLQFMRDGLGMQSTSWETKYEDTIEVDEASDVTIETLSERARSMAIRFYAKLVEEVGIPPDGAKEAAEKAWPVKPSAEA
jgi:hypothetical protein